MSSRCCSHVILILTDTMCDPCLDKVCVGDLSDHVVPVVGVVAGPVDGSHLVQFKRMMDQNLYINMFFVVAKMHIVNAQFYHFRMNWMKGP